MELTAKQKAQLRPYIVAVAVSATSPRLSDGQLSIYGGCYRVEARTEADARRRATEHALLRWNKDDEKFVVSACEVYQTEQVPELLTEREGERFIAVVPLALPHEPATHLAVYQFHSESHLDAVRVANARIHEIHGSLIRSFACQPLARYQKLTAWYEES